MKDINYGELVDCQGYAEKVIDFYKMCNNGKLPMSRNEAELSVREYNKEHRSFKAIYGYSIRGYIDTIVECIGMIVEV